MTPQVKSSLGSDAGPRCIKLMNGPEWRNWQTHETQNLAPVTRRVGSIPSSGTNLRSRMRRKRELRLASQMRRWAFTLSHSTPQTPSREPQGKIPQ